MDAPDAEFRPRRRAGPAWLALWAMLAVSLLPALSRGLVAARHADELNSAECRAQPVAPETAKTAHSIRAA
jgi:hypothetical protein